MDGMELSRFLHDNYPDIVIVIFSGFGEFEYAKKAIQYGVSEYMLKPVTAMELRNVIGKMKEKVDQQRKEKEKLERLTQTSENYQKNAIVSSWTARRPGIGSCSATPCTGKACGACRTWSPVPSPSRVYHGILSQSERCYGRCFLEGTIHDSAH